MLFCVLKNEKYQLFSIEEAISTLREQKLMNVKVFKVHAAKKTLVRLLSVRCRTRFARAPRTPSHYDLTSSHIRTDIFRYLKIMKHVFVSKLY